MTTSASMSSVKQYALQRLDSCLSLNRVHGAQCWALSAFYLDPKDGDSLLKAYCIAKEHEETREAANTLARLVDVDNVNNTDLMKELRVLMEAKSAKTTKCVSVAIFDALDAKSRRKLLLHVLRNETHDLAFIQNFLLATKLDENLVSLQGEEVLEKLIQSCSAASSTDSNPMLEALVLEVAPKVVTEIELKGKISLQLLKLVVEFVCHRVTSEIRHKHDGVEWRPIVLQLATQLGRRLKWQGFVDALEHRNLESINKDGSDSTFYAATMLFLLALGDLGRDLGRFSSQSLILVESIPSEEQEPQCKKARLQFQESAQKTNNSVAKIFRNCASLYEYIVSNEQLASKLNAIKPMMHYLDDIIVDLDLYLSRPRQALQMLRRVSAEDAPAQQRIMTLVKMGSASLASKDLAGAVEHLISAVELCSKSALDTEPVTNALELRVKRMKNNAFVSYIPLSKSSILEYCIRVTVSALKERAALMDNDTALGQLIILLQRLGDEEKSFFRLLMNRIRVREVFSYPQLCSNLVHIDFLEELAFLLADPACKTALDIAVTTASSQQRRMGTRKANKGEKEEMRNAIRKQVETINQSMDPILAGFLSANKDAIIQNLV